MLSIKTDSKGYKQPEIVSKVKKELLKDASFQFGIGVGVERALERKVKNNKFLKWIYEKLLGMLFFCIVLDKKL